MADYIPFITGDDVCNLVNTVYPDSDMVRVPLDRAERLIPLLPDARKVWLDPCVDGMDDLESRRIIKDHRNNSERKNPWFEFISKFPSFDRIGDPAYHANPVAAEVYDFVNEVMEKCAAYKPAWITVPQIPLVESYKRNKINRALAKATGKWKGGSNFSGCLILPLVFTNQKQVNLKEFRKQKVRQAEWCYREAQADGFWVVESSLKDDSGSSTLRGKRFPKIIILHEELNDCISSKIRIAGPYWGLNLVLWARGLVDYPAIGIGSSYQYLLAGGTAMQSSARLMLSSLRRRVGIGELGTWLDEVMAKLGPSHPLYLEFNNIKRNLPTLSDKARAREQIATRYKQWYDTIASVPKAGRSMALFQDLASAFALGRSLPDLRDTKPRRPEAVAEQLMLSCL